MLEESLLRFGWGLMVLTAIVTLAVTGAPPVLVLPLVGFLPHPAQLTPRRRRPPDRPPEPPQVQARPDPASSPAGQG